MSTLRWEDFDRETNSVFISRQLVGDYRGRFKELKGKKSPRALVLPKWWAFHEPEAEGIILDLPVAERKYLMDKILEAAGLKEPGIRYHVLRHTYARRCLEDYGVSMMELRNFLGHSSVVVTENSYGHFSEGVALARGAEKVYGMEQMAPTNGTTEAREAA